MAKGGGSTTQTTKTEPWEGQQDYYKQIFGEAQRLYNAGGLAPKAYEGQTIAGLTPEQQQAQQMITQNATGNPLIGNAQGLANRTIAGDYLDVTKNPGFSQGLADIKKAYSTGTAAQTDAAAARGGAFGGSAYNELVGQNNRAYGDSLNKFAGDIYNTERGRQEAAMQFSPVLNQAGYYNADRLSGVGAENQALNQAQINSDIEKFNLRNQSPISALQYYQGLIGGNLGGTTTQTIYRHYNNQLGSKLARIA